MKNLKFILIAAFSLLLTATSCKKEKNEPAPVAATPAAPVVTYSNFSIDIALVDRGNCAGVFGTTRTAYIVCNSVRIDSLLALDTTFVPASTVFAACPAPSYVHVNTKSFKIQDGADNYLEIYNDGVRITSSKINVTSARLEGINLGGCPTYPDNFSQWPGGCSSLCIPQW